MTRAKRFELRQLDAWTEDLSDRFLLCRDVGHTWRPQTAGIEQRSYWRMMRCPRCGTERFQTLSMSGEVLAGHYSYPDGYLTPKGMGSLTGEHRSHLRLESVLRLIAKEEAS